VQHHKPHPSTDPVPLKSISYQSRSREIERGRGPRSRPFCTVQPAILQFNTKIGDVGTTEVLDFGDGVGQIYRKEKHGEILSFSFHPGRTEHVQIGTSHHTKPHHTTPHYPTLHTTLHYTTLHYTTPHNTVLHSTLHSTTLHYTTLHYTTLHDNST
jgi:hypothetical protein